MANEIKLDLPKVDDLFSTEEERKHADAEKVFEIDISLIDDFPDHPFQIRFDDDMNKLIDSIKSNGVLVPVILRPKGDRYEMIAGHRRKTGSIKAEQQTIPAVVRNLTDDEAIIIMVDSNLQRENILPSERAFSYKMKLEAMKRQGERSDLTSVPVAQKLSKTSREILADEVGESQDQVRRYIRLTELIPEILQMVDDSKIAFRPAVELSYLKKEEQESLLQIMQIDEVTPSLAQAIKIKKFSQDNSLNDEVILSIMSEEKPNQVEQFKMPKDRIKKYFPTGTPKEKIEETIVKALEFYQRKKERDMSR